MAASIPTCSWCTLRHHSITATKWCKECEEGLCDTCQELHWLAKVSRNHSIIPIEDYLIFPQNILAISKFCEEHDKEFIIYCKEHDKPCCSKCVVQSHKKCHDIENLEDVIHNIKSSHLFNDLESNLQETRENIQIIRKDRNTFLTALDDNQKLMIEKVQITREKINKHLDKIQECFLEEINSSSDIKRSLISKFLVTLDEQEGHILKDLDLLANIKQYGSSLQKYIGILQIQQRVLSIEASIEGNHQVHSCQNHLISCAIDKSLETFEERIKHFGTFQTISFPSEVHLQRKKEKQAQIMVQMPQTKRMDDIKLECDVTLNDIGRDIYGCCILPDGRAAFTNYFTKFVRVRDIDGSEELLGCCRFSFDIAVIDHVTMAVSNGCGSTGINIINTESKQINKILSNLTNICGLTYIKDHLIFCQEKKGVQMVNLHSQTITDIVNVELPLCSFVTSSNDKIFVTNSESDTVTCYDMKGEMVWVFKDDGVLKEPRGIAFDNDGYIYVAGRGTNNVVVISTDGQRYREILHATSDKMKKFSNLWSLFYDRLNNKLLVGKFHNTALLFSVK